MDEFPASTGAFPPVAGDILTFPATAGLSTPRPYPYWPSTSPHPILVFPSGKRPQHYWPFKDTGNYSDQGSVGGLPVVPGFVPPPYDSPPYSWAAPPLPLFNNGLVTVNPDDVQGSWVQTPYNQDVSHLGDVWSIIIKVDPLILPGGINTKAIGVLFSNASVDQGAGIEFNCVNSDDTFQFYIFSDGNSNAIQKKTLPYNFPGKFTVILTFNVGVVHLYIDGIDITNDLIDSSFGTVLTVPDNGGQGFLWGNYVTGPYAPLSQPLGDGSIIALGGVLKGTAWSQADVTAIQAALG